MELVIYRFLIRKEVVKGCRFKVLLILRRILSSYLYLNRFLFIKYAVFHLIPTP